MPDQPEIIVAVRGVSEHTDGRYRVLEIDHDYSDPDNPALKLWLDPDSEQPDGGFRLRDPDQLTVYPAVEALYGRCDTCGEIRWHTEFHEEGRGAAKRSPHCGCCTHPHDLEPGGHDIARGEAR